MELGRSEKEPEESQAGVLFKILFPAVVQFVIVCFSLALLWCRLIDHLRVEWTVNPQYTYGWAVPFLCLFLLWRRASPAVGDDLRSRSAKPISVFPHVSFSVFAALLAFLYLPTRLTQEANPEWRLVSWALALEVVGITCWVASKSQVQSSKSQVGALVSWLRPVAVVWPLAFFLVATPWPTVLEGPLVQGLTRANTAVTVELVDLFGVPALQHGNAIEVGTGMVGIDEACSGIRSFQVTLMLALFFGEVFRLSLLRRVGLCAAGFALSFLFNAARTTLLTWIAGTEGAAAMRAWHDPAGAAIVVGCFGSIWLLARWWRVTPAHAVLGRPSSILHTPSSPAVCPPAPRSNASLFNVSLFNVSLFNVSRFNASRFNAFLLAWLLSCELGTEAWYRFHESKLPPPVTWDIQPPVDNPSLRQVTFSEKTRQFLRFDEAVNVAWDENEKHFQAIFLRWKPGRTAVHLAKTHTPEACVTAAGDRLLSKSDIRLCSVAGLGLPFRAYVFETLQGPLHVYYCLWEDRAPDGAFDAASLTYANRLEPVLAGRRLSGQRSLELAIWGCSDPDAADTAMREELAKIVRSGENQGPKPKLQSPK